MTKGKFNFSHLQSCDSQKVERTVVLSTAGRSAVSRTLLISTDAVFLRCSRVLILQTVALLNDTCSAGPHKSYSPINSEEVIEQLRPKSPGSECHLLSLSGEHPTP